MNKASVDLAAPGHDIIVISSPDRVSSEIRKVSALLEAGLMQFHVRKPGFDDFDMISYLSSIPVEYHGRIVLHSHFYLVEQFKLKGIQLGKDRITEGKPFKNTVDYVGYSAHSFEEIEELKDEFRHFFLSPVYPSISKPDYAPHYSLEEIEQFLQNNPGIHVSALGGITSGNARQTLNMGFKGIAMLGNIWESTEPTQALSSVISQLNQRPFVLSIAGFDPCSGAGVSADIKTFEQNKTQGLAVTTAITYQNEDQFDAVDWLSFARIKKQIDVLFQKYDPQYVKIGLVENLEVLEQIILLLKSHNTQVTIVWDPILKSSTQFGFHKSLNKEKLDNVLKAIDLITPNIPESIQLFEQDDPKAIQSFIAQLKYCNVLLKGGHRDSEDVSDVFITPEEIRLIDGKRSANNTKHGTGCVLSAAICAGLANGKTWVSALKDAKKYTRDFIDSNNGLLGYHA